MKTEPKHNKKSNASSEELFPPDLKLPKTTWDFLRKFYSSQVESVLVALLSTILKWAAEKMGGKEKHHSS